MPHSYHNSGSPPRSQAFDLRIPVLEEADEDGTSSDPGNDLLTPTDIFQTPPSIIPTKMNSTSIQNGTATFMCICPTPPRIQTTSATPPPPPQETAPESEPQIRGTALHKTIVAPERPSSRRRLSSIFRRTHSQSVHPNPKQIDSTHASVNSQPEHLLEKAHHGRLSSKNIPATQSAFTSRPDSPSTPGAPHQDDAEEPVLTIKEPSTGDFGHSRKKNQSSTGLSLLDRFSIKSHFTPHGKEPIHEPRRPRTTSVVLESAIQDETQPNDSLIQLPSRQVWGMVAQSGTGLKSRRLSMSLPDTFWVDAGDLYAEYSNHSKIIGRRGKTIGKGATANVKLMHSKEGGAGEVFAVKEFRGKSINEQNEDYEQKVKSEFTIAKSAHHPNIVETFRLCTYNGRWNHVMEFCEEGDLFGLVSQKYLSREDRLLDRLCLFKQIVQGIHYLHANGIAHRDIKLENLLLTKECKLKITDFGVSEVFSGIHPGLREAGGQCGKDMGEVRLCAPGMCGSPPYVAPEVIAKQGEYDPRPLDVWGAAIVMLCMCANGVLWNEAKAGSSPLYDDLVCGWTKWNAKHPDGADGITESDYPHVPFFDQHIKPPALRRILLTMLNTDPAKRVSIATIAQNRWMKNVECCQIDRHGDCSHSVDASVAQPNAKKIPKVIRHNHLPASAHHGHRLVRLPGSTEMP